MKIITKITEELQKRLTDMQFQYLYYYAQCFGIQKILLGTPICPKLLNITRERVKLN